MELTLRRYPARKAMPSPTQEDRSYQMEGKGKVISTTPAEITEKHVGPA